MDRKIHNNHDMIENFLVTIFLPNQKMAKVERVYIYMFWLFSNIAYNVLFQPI